MNLKHNKKIHNKLTRSYELNNDILAKEIKDWEPSALQCLFENAQKVDEFTGEWMLANHGDHER